MFDTSINNRNFTDLIDNAMPEKVPLFDDKGEVKGSRYSEPSMLKVGLDDHIVTTQERKNLPESTRSALSRIMTTANSSSLTNFSKPNTVTWKHMILAAGVLARAGTSFDTSGQFEGTPFFPGFDSHFGAAWLGENAAIPEQTATVIRFPYEIHSIGSFSLVSRRFRKLAPYAVPQVQIGQAIAIKNAVEEALINGDSAVDQNQPDGLVKQVTDQILNGAAKSGLVILSETLEVLESNGLDKDALAVIMSPDVAKKFREETGAKAHPSLNLLANRMLVSKYMPSGTLVAGRYSDYQAVTGDSIEFLAHTYTPAGRPETGETRIRSLFDVDAKVLNQESFVKVTGIA